jgi:serine/threonine protein phosphatase PrpC
MIKDLKYISLSGVGPRMLMQDVGLHNSSEDGKIAWFIICDGIGGSDHGEVAAKIAAEELDRYLKSTLQRASQLDDQDYFQAAIDQIRRQFIHAISGNPKYMGMGSTLCALIITKQKAYSLWAGDSRSYLFRDGECLWDVFPHNWSFDLYRKGVLSLDEARISESNYISASINGYTGEIHYEVEVLTVKKHDRFLVCTDGIWGLFEHKDISAIFQDKKLDTLKTKLTDYLSEYANDNYFGYVIDVK